MAYHVHNALKYRVLGEVMRIEEERKNNPVADKADLNVLYERLDDVEKTNLGMELNHLSNLGYIIKKEYITPRNRCKYYYVIGEVGKKVFPRLHEKIKNGESLNLRNPNNHNGSYIKISKKQIEQKRESLIKKKREIEEKLEKLEQEEALLDVQ